MKVMEQQKKFLNMDELSQYVGMSKSYLYKRVCNKTIPFIKLGTRTVFVSEEIDKWVLNNGRMSIELPVLQNL
jgi:excisionase family DNA binding protein